MGDFFKEVTEAAETADGLRVTFPAETAFFGVNGGYLAATVLRLAGRGAALERPLSLSCNFLKSVKPGGAWLKRTQIVETPSATCVQVELGHNERTCLLAHVWLAGEAEGPSLDGLVMPLVPHPDELRTMQEIMRPDEPALPKFWNVFEQRPINRIMHDSRIHRLPRLLRWFRPMTVEASDPFLDAARILPVIDIMGLSASSASHDRRNGPFLKAQAVTMELTVHFYARPDAGDWLLCDAYGDYASQGVVSNRVVIWNVRGGLVAHGFSQMLAR